MSFDVCVRPVSDQVRAARNPVSPDALDQSGWDTRARSGPVRDRSFAPYPNSAPDVIIIHLGECRHYSGIVALQYLETLRLDHQIRHAAFDQLVKRFQSIIV